MASAAQSLRLLCRSCRSQRPIRQVAPKVFVAWKSVSGGAIKEVKITEDDSRPTPFDKMYEDMDRLEERAASLTPEQALLEAIQDLEAAHPELQESKLRERAADELKKTPNWGDSLKTAAREVYAETSPLRAIIKPPKDSFWNSEEADSELVTRERAEDDEFKEDDMTSVAHAKLEEHREHREYARIAIWEMPLLSKFAKPFERPNQDMPLRFRYTTYMGENHPAEKKVVVEFCPADLGLTDVQQMKLKKLAGPRYNPETEIIRMSCEIFEHQAQNKRYLGDLVQKLVIEAKDPTDTFEDVPLDTRHHKFSVKPKFPKEWRLTAERRKELEDFRQQTLLLDEKKKAEGTLIDGKVTIEKAFAAPRVDDKLRELVAMPVRNRSTDNRPIRR